MSMDFGLVTLSRLRGAAHRSTTFNWRTNTSRDLSMEELMPGRGSNKDRYELYSYIKTCSVI